MIANHENCRILAVGMALLLIFALRSAMAGAPEYMKLDKKPGQALEIEGSWDSSGVFVATNIEKLPKERLPKLRGTIQHIDRKDSTILMHGRSIKFYNHTEFVEDGGEQVTFNSLKSGQRIEVSCRIDENGQWKARKIKTKDVKQNDKIKGTVTQISMDGNPPDTIEIDGLRILLTRDTDINDPSSNYDRIEKNLFKHLVSMQSWGASEGISIGRGYHFYGDFRQSVRNEKEYNLDHSDLQDTELGVRLELAAYWGPKMRSLAQLRVRKSYLIANDRSNPPTDKFMAQFTQLYVMARDIGGSGFAFQIGRQDIEETREWLFDDYLDAVRLYYYGGHPLVFQMALIRAVSPLNPKFRTWTDFFGQSSYYFNRKNVVSGYILTRRDSDDIRNREPVWLGVRYQGLIRDCVKPWLELSYMGGEDKGKTLRATAIDVGTIYAVNNLRFTPFLGLSYAIGTGDKTAGDKTDNTFRQTGYQDNVDYLGGVSLLKYYGELLDPELGNLKIFTGTIGFYPTATSSFQVVYHSYSQHQLDQEMQSMKLLDPPARPNGINADLGWELDFVAGVTDIWQRVCLAWTIGIFDPGQAFSPYLEKATSNKINLKISL
jgi:hypothetical protein